MLNNCQHYFRVVILPMKIESCMLHLPFNTAQQGTNHAQGKWLCQTAKSASSVLRMEQITDSFTSEM